MDELAATANMDLAALAKWGKRPSPQKDLSKNDPLGGCLIVNRLAVHLQNAGLTIRLFWRVACRL